MTTEAEKLETIQKLIKNMSGFKVGFTAQLDKAIRDGEKGTEEIRNTLIDLCVSLRMRAGDWIEKLEQVNRDEE
jgi:hypothetical protein